ncbi:hypothetical protein MT325_m802L [Paramecium bursaria chlorella virus MT325]|uniref:Uncharacterized protein m802L n=1 Tax=Paramecium bursaria Chlorella virus MT325 TaxID=346932 RepID=A7IVI2_PBCVM|nr:hypothetical protein MT325_m802L [Paramecium bursaria chlorella virus MT325]
MVTSGTYLDNFSSGNRVVLLLPVVKHWFCQFCHIFLYWKRKVWDVVHIIVHISLFSQIFIPELLQILRYILPSDGIFVLYDILVGVILDDLLFGLCSARIFEQYRRNLMRICVSNFIDTLLVVDDIIYCPNNCLIRYRKIDGDVLVNRIIYILIDNTNITVNSVE